MKKTLAFLLAAGGLAVASPVFAATRWDSVSAQPGTIAVKGTFTASNGTDPSLASTTTESLGVPLTGIAGLTVIAESCSAFSGATCSTAGGNMTAGGKFVAYLRNRWSGLWAPVSDGSLDLVTSAVGRQAWAGFTVSADADRIAWEPSGVGTSAQLYIVATKRR